MGNLLTADLVKTMIEQAPAILVLLYVAWQQQKLIDLIIETCMRKFENDEDSSPRTD